MQVMTWNKEAAGRADHEDVVLSYYDGKLRQDPLLG